MSRLARAGRRASGAVVALACALALAGCGGEEDPTAPLEVTVGEEFTWNDFTVQDGWKIEGVERSMGLEDPEASLEISGSIVNNSEEERAPIFQIVLSNEGNAEATLNCSAMKLAQGQSGGFLCPGLGQLMPEEYDTVTVMPIRRDTGESGSDGSGT